MYLSAQSNVDQPSAKSNPNSLNFSTRFEKELSIHKDISRINIEIQLYKDLTCLKSVSDLLPELLGSKDSFFLRMHEINKNHHLAKIPKMKES